MWKTQEKRGRDSEETSSASTLINTLLLMCSLVLQAGFSHFHTIITGSCAQLLTTCLQKLEMLEQLSVSSVFSCCRYAVYLYIIQLELRFISVLPFSQTFHWTLLKLHRQLCLYSTCPAFLFQPRAWGQQLSSHKFSQAMLYFRTAYKDLLVVVWFIVIVVYTLHAISVLSLMVCVVIVLLLTPAVCLF